MTLLTEIPHTRQIADEPPRRWFRSPDMELVVWGEADDEIVGFQLSYATGSEERALTWKQGLGFDHSAVDSGEQTPLFNRTPLLVADGEFDAEGIMSDFISAGGELPTAIRQFVMGKLDAYPAD